MLLQFYKRPDDKIRGFEQCAKTFAEKDMAFESMYKLNYLKLPNNLEWSSPQNLRFEPAHLVDASSTV